jgi:hypothetical protein
MMHPQITAERKYYIPDYSSINHLLPYFESKPIQKAMFPK